GWPPPHPLSRTSSGRGGSSGPPGPRRAASEGGAEPPPEQQPLGRHTEGQTDRETGSPLPQARHQDDDPDDGQRRQRREEGDLLDPAPPLAQLAERRQGDLQGQSGWETEQESPDES